MADGPESLPVIDPETREGRSVSIITDRRLIVRAVENGWIRDVEIMRELRDECRQDLEAYEALDPGPDELFDRRVALAKVAQGAVNASSKVVSTAEGKGDGTTTNNTQINNTIDLSGLSIQELKERLALIKEARDAING
jgi:hypothetical protein